MNKTEKELSELIELTFNPKKSEGIFGNLKTKIQGFLMLENEVNKLVLAL